MSDERSAIRSRRDGQDVERLLDAAIASYELRPLPDRFVERTMSLAQETPRMTAAQEPSVVSGAVATSAAIDEAIDSYPLESLPAGVIERTMIQVRADQAATSEASDLAPTRAPRFVDALQFMDLAVPAFAAVFALAVVGLAYVAWRAADPLTVAALELELRRAALAAPFGWADAVRATLLMASAGLLLVGASAAVVWIDRRRLVLRQTMEARRA
jgi:hypothetical protein